MNALLDTNIIIHRENNRITNQSIGQLFYWLDKLHYDKLIHPLTIEELEKYKNTQVQDLYAVKLYSYIKMETMATQTPDFISILHTSNKTDNDKIDNQLLCEIFNNRADILITEDRRMRNKALSLGIADKVFSINAFISKVTAENPELLNYKALSVRKTYFGNADVGNIFFDSFRDAYLGFDTWFAKKSNEEAYICRDDNNIILGFLYLKVEQTSENYFDITPPFPPKKRLKVGTFKVESTGFRLGERFIKIIFDNAIAQKVDEVYVTLFINRQELKALAELFKRWGFCIHGRKEEETVFVKKMGTYNKELSTKENYPNLTYQKQKFILPIFPKYHTTLLPDSVLRNENEVDFLGNLPHRYALQKVYVSWASEPVNVTKGDFLFFYRMGDTTPKKYSSVVTTLGVVDEIIRDFRSQNDFLSICQNRSVFSKEDLEGFWNSHRYNLKIIKFIYVKSFTKKLTLEYLWNKNIVPPPGGPRPFTKITNEQFNEILKDSQTEIYI